MAKKKRQKLKFEQVNTDFSFNRILWLLTAGDGRTPERVLKNLKSETL